MAAYLHAGFDTNRIGVFSVPVTDADGSRTATVTASTYCHTDISSVATGYSDFATAVATALNAGATGTPWGVAWTLADHYTLTYSGTATISFASAVNGNMARTLGFSTGTNYGFTSGFPTQSSPITPYYHLDLSRDGVSDYSRPYVRSGQAERQVSSNATAYAVRPSVREKRVEFRASFQALATVFADEASATVPWTYEDLMEHAWMVEPILLHTSTLDIVYKNTRAEFDKEARSPAWSNYHAKWHLDVKGQYLGSL